MDAPLQQIKDWILKRHPEREDIPGDLDLIENRLIDSLTFVEFLFLLEQLSGRSIDMDAIDIEDVRCLDVIHERYLLPVG
ncbi:acyl carrier protein [Streptomyces sp. So13.3]|uniref:acyl carrier protein n=1 Tax=unclassified Streptomyces TaxID=2593676 RepID=UPI001105F0F8|nr:MULTISPECIES: acyl carrier protein [unclassified Streptomyces]MCZ4102295.1 acyl carrier protein [Streptomyces sp. H39-C1]QNA76380.1 acyl carrier protein [Streptomyces sp. So13.3]